MNDTATENLTENGVTTCLLGALQKAMQSIGNASRSGNFSSGKYSYSYASLKDYLEAVREPCLENGLILHSQMSGQPILDSRETGSGVTMAIARVQVVTTVHHVESGGSLSASAWGEGQDSLDKAISKAITGARKYSIAMLFGIHTTDDSEDTTRGKGDRTAWSNVQHEQFLEVVRETSATESDSAKQRLEACLSHIDNHAGMINGFRDEATGEAIARAMVMQDQGELEPSEVGYLSGIAERMTDGGYATFCETAVKREKLNN